ncbi:hypothetical protein SDRG_10699 [Saprolegnia diclina VS20]|uniref:Uncharacterized protein n=1 Tax=Saprolegnia diclina (strain VS20) TaxID=1156394 RepID=T0QD99_SAPDV|nr:hypothetical protein SDRG_10699 [Saprolegnia diclina VS20]EQC31525.1 hypothetical protein SDRG_10699 [Saprolegnia diclina VS20]|eukprot:XP_008614924.1 hypothetical protein SDRG_10699 [Saprolegnia diclina VS20]
MADDADAGCFAQPLDSTDALMYASRMQYLHSDENQDKTRPDALFMSRRQVKKHSEFKIHTSPIPALKKIEPAHSLHHHHHRKTSGLRVAQMGAAMNGGWIPCFQAGCHFWQHKETGQCVPSDALGKPCPFHAPNEQCAWTPSGTDEASDDEATPPFPASFKFLEPDVHPHSTKPKKAHVSHIVVRKSER